MRSTPDPTSATPCNCLAIRQAARHVTQLYEAHLAPTGLRATQLSVLARLARLGPLSLKELAADLVMDRTTLGRALRPLERERLLEIARGRDGRTRALSVTAAGHERLKKAAPLWDAAQRAFEASYGRAAAADLRASLTRVLAAA